MPQQFEQAAGEQAQRDSDAGSAAPYRRRFEFSLLDAQRTGFLADAKRTKAALFPQLSLGFTYGLDSYRVDWQHRGYAATAGVTFPVFAKVDVNGPNAHPLWRYLTQEKPGILGTEAIKWNFTKFLVNRDGIPVARYAPRDKPEALEKAIEKLL